MAHDYRADDYRQHTAHYQAEAELRKLVDFRAAHPARYPKQHLVPEPSGRPTASQQKDWHVYTRIAKERKIQIQPLIVPVLNPQPLAGATKPIDNIQGTQPHTMENGEEHVTNILRMEILLQKHPMVADVNRYKEHKFDDNMKRQVFDDSGNGRVKPGGSNGHQSHFDLQCHIKGTNATFRVGCTVNAVKATSIALWCQPLHNFVFEDIALSWEANNKRQRWKFHFPFRFPPPRPPPRIPRDPPVTEFDFLAPGLGGPGARGPANCKAVIGGWLLKPYGVMNQLAVGPAIAGPAENSHDLLGHH